MDHYESLGVRSDASAEQIKRAYVDLARRHHPDFHTTDDPATRRDAERRMREVNAAWQVLGVETARQAYDRTRAGGSGAGGSGGSGPVIHRPSSAFTPYFDEDEDDDDSWRYEPDEGDPATAPPRSLLIAPPALFVIGIVLVVVSLTTGIDALTALGLGALGFSALCFVGAPVVAMFRSQIVEERSQRRH